MNYKIICAKDRMKARAISFIVDPEVTKKEKKK